jgi:hypothetical protein
MDAKPILFQVARALREQGLDAVLIGNAAAAIQGAPVTTVDLDLFMPKTPGNLKKLKGVANSLEAVIFRPFYPVSGLFRLSRDTDALQVDFMTRVDGVGSYRGVRSRATVVDFGGEKLWVADLVDIIESKRAAGRPLDRAVLDVLKATLKEKEKEPDPGRDSSSPPEGKRTQPPGPNP